MSTPEKILKRINLYNLWMLRWILSTTQYSVQFMNSQISISYEQKNLHNWRWVQLSKTYDKYNWVKYRLINKYNFRKMSITLYNIMNRQSITYDENNSIWLMNRQISITYDEYNWVKPIERQISITYEWWVKLKVLSMNWQNNIT